MESRRKTEGRDYRTGLQTDLIAFYEPYREADVSGRLNRIYNTLGNNGYSYRKRIQKIKSELESPLSLSEKKYVVEALNIVYQRMNSRKRGKFNRVVKDRIEASKELMELIEEIGSSFEEYSRLEERYLQEDSQVSSKMPHKIYPVKNFYRKAGSVLLKVAGGLVGGVIIAGVSALAGWNLGNNRAEEKYLPQLKERTNAVSELEKNLEEKDREFSELEGKLEVAQTKNFELQEKNLKLADEVSSKKISPPESFSRITIEIPKEGVNSQLEVHGAGEMNLKITQDKPMMTVTPHPQESSFEKSEKVYGKNTSKMNESFSKDTIDERFNAYGRHLGKVGAKQWKEGKPVESILTGAFSWISLGGEILRQGYEPVAELTGGAIGVIASPSKEHNKEGWRNGIKKGEDTARFFYRNWWGGPNWNYDFAKAGEFVTFNKLDFGTEGDPFIKDDSLAGAALRIGADISAGAIIANNFGSKKGSRGPSNISGGTSSSPGGIPR